MLFNKLIIRQFDQLQFLNFVSYSVINSFALKLSIFVRMLPSFLRKRGVLWTIKRISWKQVLLETTTLSFSNFWMIEKFPPVVWLNFLNEFWLTLNFQIVPVGIFIYKKWWIANQKNDPVHLGVIFTGSSSWDQVAKMRSL